MKKIYSVFLFLVFAKLTIAQATLPAPFALTSGNYSLTGWDSASAAGTYPANMIFHYNISSENSAYNHLAEGARDYDCGYNLKARNRIVGFTDSGFAFLATSSAQYNDCTSGTADSNRFVGDAVLAINSLGKTDVQVKWTGIIYLIGDGSGDPTAARQATVRLQYRVGATGNYTDVLNGTDTAECKTTGRTALTAVAVSATLPAACNNQALVYLRWVYFSLPVTGSKGTRPEILVDDIVVGTGVLPLHLLSFGLTNNNGAAALSWKTTNEVNVSHFEVERSSNGITYSSIATVVAKGGLADNAYTYTDLKPATGNDYYRLKMTDKNGSFSYSNTVRLSAIATSVLSVKPNPVVGSSFVLTHPQAGRNAVAIVYGFDGKRAVSYPVKENNTQTTISTISLAKGNYIVVYLDGGKKLSVPFSKN